MITSQGIGTSMIATHISSNRIQLALELVAATAALAKEESASATAASLSSAE